MASRVRHHVRERWRSFWSEWSQASYRGGAPGRARVVALSLIATLYFAVPNARPDFSRFNCHDSESYLALAHSLVNGRGYTRSMDPSIYVPHTTWPPALPLLLMPAVAISGRTIDWLAVKWTICLVGIIGLVLIWRLTRRISGDNAAADLAGVTIGLNPFYWDFAHQAMAELPLVVCLVGSLLLVDRVWAERSPRALEIAAAGLLSGVGMLIKGHAAAIVLAPLAYLWGERRSKLTRAAHAASWILFASCFMAPSAGWFVRNIGLEAPGLDGLNQVRMIRARTPMDPSSRLLTASESVSIVVRNVKEYAIYRLPEQIVPGLWYEPALSWNGAGFAALLLTLLLIAVGLERRTGVLAIALVVLPVAALNLSYRFGGSRRYWIPVAILLTVPICIRLAAALRALGPVRLRVLVPALLALLAANLGLYMAWHERQPFKTAGPWRELAAMFDRVRDHPLETDGVWTPNPHAFTLITGYPAPMPVVSARFDHAIARTDGGSPAPPAGAELLVEVEPWGLYALDRSMAADELSAPSLRRRAR